MRDDFPYATKIALAMGTGLTCSNPGCRVFTGGPDSNIGVAAHITGASSGGPRYDAALTALQRKTGSNGIWLCQACAKLVDSPSCDQEYPRALLELWKQIAENRARAYIGCTSPVLDGFRPVSAEHGRLLEVSTAQNQYQLFEALSGQPNTYSTTSTAREQLSAHTSPKTTLEWVTEIMISCWGDGDSLDLLGTCAVLLSTSIHQWRPSEPTLAKLEALCKADVNAGDPTRAGVIEPLVFALAAKRSSETYRRFLSAEVGQNDWRKAQDARSTQYWGSEGETAAAVARHLRDPHRLGLLRANDVGRLLTLITKPRVDLARPQVRRLLMGLLRESVRELQDAGETVLANHATKYLLSHGFDLNSG